MTNLLLSLVLAFTLQASTHSPTILGEGEVYICASKTSVAYHSSKDCKGLKRCTHDIIKISEQGAKANYNKRKCRMCY